MGTEDRLAESKKKGNNVNRTVREMDGLARAAGVMRKAQSRRLHTTSGESEFQKNTGEGGCE